MESGEKDYITKKDVIDMPSALNNQVNLCDSCTYTYPECPSEKDDVIFGNGIGNDNICACNKYQPTVQTVATDTNVGDTIYRKAAAELAMKYCPDDDGSVQCGGDIRGLLDELENLPSAQPSQDKYEYHYDHTDCIWYRPEARNRCPATCAQYRDGWNDAMNYIFRDGEGYRPFRRDKKYEG